MPSRTILIGIAQIELLGTKEGVEVVISRITSRGLREGVRTVLYHFPVVEVNHREKQTVIRVLERVDAYG